MNVLRWFAIIVALCIVHQSHCIFIGHRRVKRHHDALPIRFSRTASQDVLSHDNLDIDLSDNVIVSELAITRDGVRKYKTKQMVLLLVYALRI